MDLDWLSISYFRNFGRVKEIELPKGGLLVAAAPNATGKTNFLESVAVLLRGKSFRAKTGDCVAWGHDSFLLQGGFTQAEGEKSEVAVRYYRPARKLRMDENGAPASVVGFYSRYPFVLFLPEDTFLFSRGPAMRRNFLSQVLVAHRQYVAGLVQYHRVLKQRNNLLKRAKSGQDIASWTEMLAEHAQILWRHREGLVTFFDDQLSEMYERMSGEKLSLRVRLQYGAKKAEDFLGELQRQFEEERRFGYTMSGPHRDDFVVTSDGHAAELALSRGQMRTLVITLKVLAHGYISQATGEEPMLLLDDVLSEMDERRSRALLENLPVTQSLMTCTAVPEVLRQRSDVYLLDLRSIVEESVQKRRRQVREEEAEDVPEDLEDRVSV